MFLGKLKWDKSVHPVPGFQFTVDSAFNASEEVALASHYEDVRIFTVGQKTQSATPLAELGTIEQVSQFECATIDHDLI